MRRTMARRNRANAIHSSSVVIFSVFQISSPSTKTTAQAREQPTSLDHPSLTKSRVPKEQDRVVQVHWPKPTGALPPRPERQALLGCRRLLPPPHSRRKRAVVAECSAMSLDSLGFLTEGRNKLLLSYGSTALRAEQVAALIRDMQEQGIRLWLMGGWGVDALLGEQTRDHHDLDLLVQIADLERFVERLSALGFEPAYVWEAEARDIHHPLWSTSRELPTAFVYVHPDGREVDTHVVDFDDAGEPSALWNTTLGLTREGLAARGVVAGVTVPCLSAELQLLAHEGYELPAHHVEDLRRLFVERSEH
jgi:lincosamide nucleotidyltransferase A/C/D/E